MLELTGLDSVMRGLGYLYWLIAIGAVALAWSMNAFRRGKIIWVSVVVVVFGFLPVKALIEDYQRKAYAKEAWAYFKKKCETEAGEKIYKTFTGVKSVLVVKPLPPATEKDLYDQFWYGDPYSNATPWGERDVSKADTLLRNIDLFGSKSIGFDFVEIQRKRNGRVVVEKLSPSPFDQSRNITAISPEKISKFAIGWEDISKPEDRKYWVAGSRLSIIDLADNSVVAERIGFFIESGFGATTGQRRPWLTSRGRNTTCPELRNGTFEDRLFILKALSPLRG